MGVFFLSGSARFRASYDGPPMRYRWSWLRINNDPSATAGDATILYCGNRGQRIGETRVYLTDGDQRELESRTNMLHVLTRHYPPDHEMLEFVNSIRVEPEAAAETQTGS